MHTRLTEQSKQGHGHWTWRFWKKCDMSVNWLQLAFRCANRTRRVGSTLWGQWRIEKRIVSRSYGTFKLKSSTGGQSARHTVQLDLSRPWHSNRLLQDILGPF